MEKQIIILQNGNFIISKDGELIKGVSFDLLEVYE